VKRILTPVQILLIAGMWFIGCVKDNKPPPVDNPSPDTNPSPGDMYIKVLEYHTNIPVSSVLYSRSYCTNIIDSGCVNLHNAGNWYTDLSGNIYIRGSDTLGNPKTEESETDMFSKKNYWIRVGYDSLTDIDSVKRAVVRLIPYAWLKIHLKNEIYHSYPVNITMHFDIDKDLDFPPIPFDAFTRYSYYSASANNLDTTFLIKTYAYFTNEIDIEQDSTDVQNYFQYGLYHGTQVVNKMDTLDWEIIIKN
jgi:hypothetical protein